MREEESPCTCVCPCLCRRFYFYTLTSPAEQGQREENRRQREEEEQRARVVCCRSLGRRQLLPVWKQSVAREEESISVQRGARFPSSGQRRTSGRVVQVFPPHTSSNQDNSNRYRKWRCSARIHRVCEVAPKYRLRSARPLLTKNGRTVLWGA